MSRFLLVVLADDLATHLQTRTGAWLLLKSVPGVESVDDLEIISQETLDAILLKPLEKPRKKRAAARTCA